MSSQVGSACYPSALAANVAIASGQAGVNLAHGGSVVVVGVASVTSTTITYQYTPVDGSASFSAVVGSVPMDCQMLDWSDGLSIGWQVGGAWLIVYALLFMTKGLRHGSDA